MSALVRAPWARVAAALVVALALVAWVPAARGDHDETEERLKLAGVAEDVRARIHKSIDAGVKFLLALQSKDGAFRLPGMHGAASAYLDGQTALASLALAHAGGPVARAGAELGLVYLVPKDGPRNSAVTFTYDAGLTAMLVAALHGDTSAARRIGWAASVGCTQTCDWWGYGVGRASAPEPAPDGLSDDENMSTSQFGALALWASTRAGGVEYPVTWRRHLVSLCARQKANGSWGYWGVRPEPAPNGYPNGTCMGFANLTLAMSALADDLPDDPVLAARAEIARRRGRAALDRDGPAVLDLGAQSGAIDYYGFYALEKACVFADLDRVGGRSWYLAGAGRLIAAQAKDGGWSSAPDTRPGMRTYDDLVSTSFALLFLLRGSETYRPSTPRDVDRGPVTPSSPPRAAPAPAPAVPVPSAPVTIVEASVALDRLDALVRARDAETADLLRALDDVGRAQRELDAPEDSPWRDRAEHVVLKAFEDALKPWSPRRNSDIAIRAAQVLGGARRGVAPSIRLAIADALRPDDVRPPSRAVLGAAFGALARLGGEATFDWIAARVTDSTRAADVRAARAALGALAACDGAGAMDRLSAVTRIVRVLEPIETAAADSAETEFRSLVARSLMESLGAAGLAALEHLCADARTGAPPTGDADAPLLTFAGYARWLSKHRDAAAAPWK